MAESIDESVSVLLWSNHTTRTVAPHSILWRGRTYRIQKTGLHHTTHAGNVLIHIFSVTDGTNAFKLQFDTDTLCWRLLEVDSDAL